MQIGTDSMMEQLRMGREMPNQSPADLREACEQFEGLLLGMVLKESFRDVFAGSKEAGLAGMDMFKDYCYEQVAATLAEEGSLGIADQLVDQLENPPVRRNGGL